MCVLRTSFIMVSSDLQFYRSGLSGVHGSRLRALQRYQNMMEEREEIPSVNLLGRRLGRIQRETEMSLRVIPKRILRSRSVLSIVSVERGTKLIFVRAFCVVFIGLVS